MSTPDLRGAARHFFREPHYFSASGGSSGLSGSSFARVDVRDTSWCLRAWPADFRKGRLRFIHRALLRSRAEGFSGVPALAVTNEGDTVLDLGGRLFDAQEWLASQPLSGRTVWERPMPNVVQSLQPGMLVSLTASVARFHNSTTGLRAEREDEQGPLLLRLTEVAREVEARCGVLLACVRARAEDDDRRIALRWLELLPAAVALAEATLRERPVCASGVSTVCHGDLWATHVHFDGTTFVGFTDYENLHLGSPAVALAHLVLHFNGWPARGRGGCLRQDLAAWGRRSCVTGRRGSGSRVGRVLVAVPALRWATPLTAGDEASSRDQPAHATRVAGVDHRGDPEA